MKMMVVFGTILIHQDSEFSGFDKMSAKVLGIMLLHLVSRRFSLCQLILISFLRIRRKRELFLCLKRANGLC